MSNTWIDGIDIDSLIRARAQFEEFRKNTSTDQEIAGAIQAFNFTYELCWKTMKRLLNARGVDVTSPREVFRASGLEKFINNPEDWIEFLYVRNLVVHTYDSECASKALSTFEKFSLLVKEFLSNIGVRID
ncbi:MAG: hypothetical protein RLZZ59_431 [Pseudomonadota bacterium]|jgi:nucleotidyltransferase substrate binding protein (TIGR01987 family)